MSGRFRRSKTSSETSESKTEVAGGPESESTTEVAGGPEPESTTEVAGGPDSGAEVAASPVTNVFQPAERGTAIIEVQVIGKRYGNIIALSDVSTSVRAGEVTCVLGDNGAGKSTFIKILAGAHEHSDGRLLIDDQEQHLSSPRAALELGIATVYQDLAVVPLMPVWRNFFLGSEITKGFGPFRKLDIDFMKKTTKTELSAMGIDLRDVEQPIGTLSGGERQCVAIARAVYFGARVLILDEPTAALGVKQSGVVLKYIAKARDRGLGVVFITHNPHHAYPVGDRFMLLRRGKSMGDFPKAEMTLDDLTAMMAGGSELESIAKELEKSMGPDSTVAQDMKADTR